MMTSRTSTPASERGAVLVHTAFALLALIAFTTFVVDYGTLWLSRRQAQNAVDAGALAGALALVYDDPNDFSDTGAGKVNAQGVATSNLVYGQAPAVDVTNDVTIQCPTCTEQCPNGSDNTCVRVDGYRDQAHNNPLPVFFGGLVGLSQQGIRATATAEITGANAIRCMLPVVLADRWSDTTDFDIDEVNFPGDGTPGPAGWTVNDAYEDTANTPAGNDTYVPPYNPGHTGWTVTGDFGRQLIVHAVHNQFSAGWANLVNLPNSLGNDDTRDDIAHCNPAQVAIADENETCAGYSPGGTTEAQALQGCLGVQTGWAQGPVSQGVGDEGKGGGPLADPLVRQDIGAHWDPAQNGGPSGTTGAVVDASNQLNMASPRIRPIAVFDLTHYRNNPGCANGGGSGCVVKVVNIIGFFVEGVCSDVRDANRLESYLSCFEDPGEHPSSQIVGRIVTLPGSDIVGTGAPVNESTFLKIVRLIR